MGMDIGGHAGPRSEINVTPLVDVVLVLLIIFMVVQPLLQRGYEVQVPPNTPPTSTPPPSDQIIVSLTANREYYLNKEKVDPANIAVRLQEILRNRSSKVVFFSAEDSVKYDDAMKLMDIVRNSGSGERKVNIGIVMDWVNPSAAATP